MYAWFWRQLLKSFATATVRLQKMLPKISIVAVFLTWIHKIFMFIFLRHARNILSGKRGEEIGVCLHTPAKISSHIFSTDTWQYCPLPPNYGSAESLAVERQPCWVEEHLWCHFLCGALFEKKLSMCFPTAICSFCFQAKSQLIEHEVLSISLALSKTMSWQISFTALRLGKSRKLLSGDEKLNRMLRYGFVMVVLSRSQTTSCWEFC